jgi:hypothetical protein
MNDYITLDGKRYRTVHENWAPLEERPMVVRRLLSGRSDVTWGPATFPGWRGQVAVEVGSQAPFGNINDFRASYRKRTALDFIDHYGASYSVVIERSVDERSLSPMWDAPDNVIKVNVTLLKV